MKTLRHTNQMKIEAIITCVNYADILSRTLPLNRIHFDRLVVATSPEDLDTRRICEYWHVETILTDEFESHWGHFCKGRGINAGLAKLDKDSWLIHMDADMALPPLTRKKLESAELDPSYLYGIDRFMCPTFEEWEKFMDLPRLQHENGWVVHLEAFPLGARVALDNIGGYLPIGFFQMWHGSTQIHRYPDEHTDAARGDVLFGQQWSRGKRALIPELIGYHLESEKAEMGINWTGRKTKKFSIGGGSVRCVPPVKDPSFRPPRNGSGNYGRTNDDCYGGSK